MDPEALSKLQAILDETSAAKVRIFAELSVLRLWVAQLYNNCNNDLNPVKLVEQMQLAADHVEQQQMEKLEEAFPGTVARIDERRQPVVSDLPKPPVW